MSATTRAALPLAIRQVIADLYADARCARRDARAFPRRADTLLPYADDCEATGRAIRTGHPYRVDRYGWPTLAP